MGGGRPQDGGHGLLSLDTPVSVRRALRGSEPDVRTGTPVSTDVYRCQPCADVEKKSLCMKSIVVAVMNSADRTSRFIEELQLLTRKNED